MKTPYSLLASLLATGSAGLVLITIAGRIPAELGFASLAVLGLLAFALNDYSRPRRSLTTPAAVLRPSLPGESSSPVAYGTRRAA